MPRYRKGQDTPPRGRKNAERWHASRYKRPLDACVASIERAMRTPSIVTAWRDHLEASMRDPIAGMTLRIVPYDCCMPAAPLYDDEPNPKET